MKKTLTPIPILIVFILIAHLNCEKSPSESESKLFTVSGKVINSQGSIRNSKVSVDR